MDDSGLNISDDEINVKLSDGMFYNICDVPEEGLPYRKYLNSFFSSKMGL